MSTSERVYDDVLKHTIINSLLKDYERAKLLREKAKKKTQPHSMKEIPRIPFINGSAMLMFEKNKNPIKKRSRSLTNQKDFIIRKNVIARTEKIEVLPQTPVKEVKTVENPLNTSISTNCSSNKDLMLSGNKRVSSAPSNQPRPKRRIINAQKPRKISSAKQLETLEATEEKPAKKPRVPTLPHNYLQNQPIVTARAWAVFDMKNNKYLFGKNTREQREVASLTKVMTCYLSVLISQEQAIPLSRKFMVSQKGGNVSGTTAEIIPGDVLTFEDLLYGMMLPSGNDAAYTLAENLGAILLEKRGENIKNEKAKVQAFLQEMNKLASKVGLTDSFYANPHGLMNYMNKSTAFDACKLYSEAMKNPLFAKVVSRKTYTAKVRNNKRNSVREITWENTNKMLNFDNFTGGKTGITDAAGPCLAVSYKEGNHELALVLLCSSSMEHRWFETRKIFNWSVQKLTSAGR